MRNLARDHWPHLFKNPMTREQIVEDMYTSVRRSPASAYFILTTTPETLHRRIGAEVVSHYGVDRDGFQLPEGETVESTGLWIVEQLWRRVQGMLE